jgi:hypothetical protein
MHRHPDQTPPASTTLCGTVVAGLALLAIALSTAPAAAQLNRTLHQDGWILAAARAPGLQGSIWRTDLWIHSESNSGASVELFFCRSGRDNSDVEGITVTLEYPRKILYIEDVVDHFLGVGGSSWVGAIHYVASAGVQVYARVYSISADGSRSYGQVVEGIPTADSSLAINDPAYPGTDEDQWMFAMKHTADNRYRVNIGVVNPTAVESPVFVSFFDTTGNFPGGQNHGQTVTVPPYSMIQLTDPFSGVTGGEWNDCIARVEADAAGSGVFGYASVVDNATNDAYFVRGVKKQRPTR